jgi:hypothetical protein
MNPNKSKKRFHSVITTTATTSTGDDEEVEVAVVVEPTVVVANTMSDQSTTTTVSPPRPQQQQELQRLQAEYQSIVRVSHRIDMIDTTTTTTNITTASTTTATTTTATATTNKLQAVLDKLLPKLFRNFQTNYQQLNDVVVAVLSKTVPVVVIPSSTTTTKESVSTTTHTATTKAVQEIRQQIHHQYIALLSQILQRLQNEPQHCLLPCLELLQQFFLHPNDDEKQQQQTHQDNNNNNNHCTNTTTTSTNTDISTAVIPTNTTTITTTTNRSQSNWDQMDSYTINFLITFLNVGIPRYSHHTNSSSNYRNTDTSIVLLSMLPHLLILYQDSNYYNNNRQNSTTTDTTVSTSSSSSTDKLAQFIRIVIHDVAHFASSSFTTVSTVTTTAAITNTTTTVDDQLYTIRILVQEQPSIAAMIYDLFLDILLYIPTSTTLTNIPPPGLSPQGWQQLCYNNNLNNNCNSNHPQFHSTWSNERQVLIRNKLAILNFIVPHQQYHIFTLHTTRNSSSSGMNHDGSSTSIPQQNENNTRTNVARMVTLLVLASCTGDAYYPEITDRASLDWKQYLDRTSTTATSSSTGSTNAGTTRTTASVVATVASAALEKDATLFGDAFMVAMELMTLCLGQIQTDMLLQHTNQVHRSALGYTGTATDTTNEQLQCQRKRRPLDETMQCPLVLTFVTNQILNEHVHLLQQESMSNVIVFSNITVQLLTRVLCSSLGSVDGLSTLRAKPYIAAAELLNVFTIRLSVQYDLSYGRNNEDDEALTLLLARCLSIASAVLLPIASSSIMNNSTNRNDGSITVRDSCYGVIATLSRCHNFALHPHGYLFGRGAASTNVEKESPESSMLASVVVNIDTASTLFGCTVNEDERLRPRAVTALDALLAAYCRVFFVSKNTIVVTIPNVVTKVNNQMDDANNPWLVTASNDMIVEHSIPPSKQIDPSSLAKLLKRLLWSAAQPNQSKASRVSAARWASDLLKEIDILHACHLLCFLSGDSDSTTASIARDGLSLPKSNGVDDNDLVEVKASDQSAASFPDFGDFTTILFTETNTYRQQRYWNFSYSGKVSTLRCGLYCLLTDLYGGCNDAPLEQYLSAITTTLLEVLKVSYQVDDVSTHGKFAIDLLDECSACLLTTLSTSEFARSLFVKEKHSSKLNLHFDDIPNIIVAASSSRSRRYLAGVYGRLLQDTNLWSADEKNSIWVEETHLVTTIDSCDRNIMDIDKRNPPLGRLHGSLFLGAHAIRALHSQAAQIHLQDIEKLWSTATNILANMGKGILHDEDILSNACSDSLSVALSSDGLDVLRINPRLLDFTGSVLSDLTRAMNKYGHGDTVNPTRTVKLVKTTGLFLASTKVVDESTEGRNVVVNSRFECIDALFELLGSLASRKTEEVSIVVGEALAELADSCALLNKEVSIVTTSTWPTEYEDDYAKQLPSPDQIMYILLRKVFPAASPHKRTACAPALLAVVARATGGVSVQHRS